MAIFIKRLKDEFKDDPIYFCMHWDGHWDGFSLTFKGLLAIIKKMFAKYLGLDAKSLYETNNKIIAFFLFYLLPVLGREGFFKNRGV
jgi:hypothetical protein